MGQRSAETSQIKYKENPTNCIAAHIGAELLHISNANPLDPTAIFLICFAKNRSNSSFFGSSI